jgi:hypothetical protein
MGALLAAKSTDKERGDLSRQFSKQFDLKTEILE